MNKYLKKKISEKNKLLTIAHKNMLIALNQMLLTDTRVRAVIPSKRQQSRKYLFLQ